MIRGGITVDFSYEEHRHRLLAWTYQRLVRHGDTTLRWTVPFDPADSPGDKLGLSEVLTRGTEEDPAELLASMESDSVEQLEFSRHTSAGYAWLTLLEMCDNRMTMVAHFLKISLSHSYRCYSRILQRSRSQAHLPLTVVGPGEFVPRPWRRFRCYREPEQLVFSFDETLDLQ